MNFLRTIFSALLSGKGPYFDVFVFIAALASIIGVILPLFNVLIRVLLSFRSRIKDLRSGLYVGRRTDLISSKSYWDYLNVTYSFGKFYGTSIYSTTNDHFYRLIAKRSGNDDPTLVGDWRNLSRPTVAGLFQLSYSAQTRKLRGCWMGPAKNGIHCGTWELRLSDHGIFKWFSLRNRMLRVLKKRKEFFGQDVLGSIIKKHEESSQETFVYDGLPINVFNTFNPTFGKISIKLLEYAVQRAGQPSSVLDIGCGSGFYGIYFAKNGSEEVVCTDIDENAIITARKNGVINQVSDKIKFVHTSRARGVYADLPVDQQYDLIIANVPFTANFLATKYKKSKYYNSFAGFEMTWYDIVLGSRFFLKKHGKLIFAFGDSGFRESLDAFITISEFKREVLDTFESSSERFQIIELSNS